ncbi:MAG: hypothetical protein WAU07_05740 [Microgenomates group bacterium]
MQRKDVPSNYSESKVSSGIFHVEKESQPESISALYCQALKMEEIDNKYIWKFINLLDQLMSDLRKTVRRETESSRGFVVTTTYRDARDEVVALQEENFSQAIDTELGQVLDQLSDDPATLLHLQQLCKSMTRHAASLGKHAVLQGLRITLLAINKRLNHNP